MSEKWRQSLLQPLYALDEKGNTAFSIAELNESGDVETVFGGLSRGDAGQRLRMICRAVNSFDPLVEALRPIMAQANEYENGSLWREFEHHKSGKSKLGIYLSFAQLTAIEAALKLAEEGK